jgi:hypothetical protein
MRTRCRFGSQRRFEATIECERWLPNDGFFPQIAQIFDIAARSVAKRLGAGTCPEPGEQVGHLERRADGLGRLGDPGLGLLNVVDREDAE